MADDIVDWADLLAFAAWCRDTGIPPMRAMPPPGWRWGDTTPSYLHPSPIATVLRRLAAEAWDEGAGDRWRCSRCDGDEPPPNPYRAT